MFQRGCSFAQTDLIPIFFPFLPGIQPNVSGCVIFFFFSSSSLEKRVYECTCYSVAHAVVGPLHDLLVLVGAVHDAGGGILSNSVTVVLRLDLHLTITVHMHTHTQIALN